MTPAERVAVYRQAVRGQVTIERSSRIERPDLPPLTMAEVEAMSPSEGAQAYRKRLR